MKWLKYSVFILAQLSLLACNKTNTVTFLGNRANNPDTVATYAPGLGVANGGFLQKSTQLGGTASVSLGANLKDLQGTTISGNRYQLNVIGQTQ